jgi:hypothetical protein
MQEQQESIVLGAWMPENSTKALRHDWREATIRLERPTLVGWDNRAWVHL